MKVKFIFYILLVASLFGYGSNLVLRDYEVWDRNPYWNRIYCTVTVKDNFGKFVENLSLQDFVISETAYDADGNILLVKNPSFENFHEQFNGPGFWEESINSDKLDIVFLVDITGSMEKYGEQIKSELKAFLKRLFEKHTDFRLVIAGYCTDEMPRWPSGSRVNFFYGPLMKAEIEQEIEEMSWAGEWWDLQWGYDAFLWTLNLNWRDDARKIVVIITDVFTDSVHGPNWYYAHGCSTSPYAVDMAMQEHNIHLYFCQPDEQNMAQIEMQQCYSELINPKVKEANFDLLLKLNTLAKKLSWPFDQSEIQLADATLIDSKYHFAWVSDFESIPHQTRDKISKVKVSISNLDQTSVLEFEYCPNMDCTDKTLTRTTVSLHLRDETGAPLSGESNVDVFLYKSIGELGRIQKISQNSDKNSVVELDLIPFGRYYYIIQTAGAPDYRYYTLGFHSDGWLTVNEPEPTYDIVVYTAYKATETYRLKGLIQEFRSMKIASNKTFQLADELENLLKEILKDGSMSVHEQAVIKRAIFSSAILINCSHYATVENDRLLDDFLQVVDKVQSMINQALKLAEELDRLKSKIESAVSIIIDIVTGNWQGIAKNLTAEALLDMLIDYIKEELPEKIMDALLEKLIETLDLPEVVAEYFSTYIRAAIKNEFIDVEKEFKDLVFTRIIKLNFVDLLDESLQNIVDKSRELLDHPAEWVNLEKQSYSLRTIFEEFRRNYMHDLFASAYNMLKIQNPIDKWSAVLTTFSEMLELVVALLQIIQSHPATIERQLGSLTDLASLAGMVKDIFPIFNKLGAMTKTFELALKVNHLLSMRPILEFVTEDIYCW